jgi:hypothetical protein
MNERNREMSNPEETKGPMPEETKGPMDDWFVAHPKPPYPGSRRNWRKALRVEVSPQFFEAVKAKPGKLRLVAEDANGVAVIERPRRPRSGGSVTNVYDIFDVVREDV